MKEKITKKKSLASLKPETKKSESLGKSSVAGSVSRSVNSPSVKSPKDKLKLPKDEPAVPRMSVPPPIPSRMSKPANIPPLPKSSSAGVRPIPPPLEDIFEDEPTLIPIQMDEPIISKNELSIDRSDFIKPASNQIPNIPTSAASTVSESQMTIPIIAEPSPSEFLPSLDFSTAYTLPIENENIVLPPVEEAKEPPPSLQIVTDVLKKVTALRTAQNVFLGPGADVVERAKTVIADCESEIARSSDKAKIALLHYEIAECYELHLEDETKALVHYQKSMDSYPEFIPAVRGAKRIFLAQKNYPSAIRLIDIEIDLEGDSRQKALLHCSKGRIYEDNLHQQTKARQCYQKAEELSSESLEVIESLKQIELKAKNWQALAPLLDRAADVVTGDVKYRAAATAEYARLLDARLKNPAAASERYLSALRMDPEVQGVSMSLKKLLYNQSRWQDLIALYEKDISSSANSEKQASDLIHVARLYSEMLGDRVKAVETLERANHAAPSNSLVLEYLVAHYAHMNNIDLQIGALKRLAAITTVENRRTILFYRIAELYERSLNDDTQAVSWYEEALRLSPTDIPTLRAVSGLYEKLGRWNALISMYLAEASGTDESKRRADAHIRAAEILEYKLGKPKDSIEHYLMALALSPESEISFKALVRLYSQFHLYKELIELYENAVEQSKDEELSFTYLFKIGFIYEDSLSRPDLAFDIYARIQKRSSKHLGAVHAMQRTAEVSGRFGDLFESLLIEIEIVKDPSRRVELSAAAAKTAEEMLHDSDKAIIWYKKVLDGDPSYSPALAGLGRLYLKLERWPELLDIYSKELKLAQTKDTKISLLTKMAELSKISIGDEDAAIRYYRKAVEIDPANPFILDALSRCLEKKGDFDTLVGIIQMEMDTLESAADKARAAVRMAEVHEMGRKDLLHASASYRNALEINPSYRPASDGFIRVNAALGQWSELADRLLGEAELINEPKPAIEYLLQAGFIYTDYLADTKKAISAFENILSRDPVNIAALKALSPILRDAGARQKLIEVHLRLANTVMDIGEKSSLLKEMARLVEAQDDTSELVRTLQAVMSVDSHDQSILSKVEQIAILKKTWSLLADVDTQRVLMTDILSHIVVYLSRMARTMESGAPNESAELYSVSSAFEPSGLLPIRGMSCLGEKIGNYELYIKGLEREANWTNSPKKSADLLVKCADTRLKTLHDINGATADLASALYRCPEHTEAAEHIYSLLTSVSQIDVLIEIMSRAADMVKDIECKAKYWRMVAKLRSEDKNDVLGAINALKRMLKSQPSHVPTMLYLADLYKQNRQWEEAYKTLESAAKQKPTKKILADIYMEASRIAASHLNNLASASSNIELLIQLEPANVEALTMQCNIQLRLGNLDAAANAADRLLKNANSPQSKADALFCTAVIKFKKNAKKSAAKAFRDAIALAGPNRADLEDYRSMLGNEEPWEEYLNALMEFQKTTLSSSSDASDAIESVAEIARVQHEGLGQPAAAVATLEQAILSLGDSPKLRFELAKRLFAAGHYSRSAAELKRITSEEPFEAEPWHLLYKVYRADGRDADAAVAGSALSVVSGSNIRDEGILTELPGLRPGAISVSALDSKTLNLLAPYSSEIFAVAALFSTLQDALSKLYSPNFEQFSLSAKERLAENHPLRMLANMTGSVFGVSEYDLYLSNSTSDIHIELTSPVSIIMPHRLYSSDQARQIFALGRVFYHITNGMHPLLKLGQDEARKVLTAVLFKVVPSGKFNMDGDASEQLSKRIYKAVSWLGKKAVDEAATALASIDNLNLVTCFAAMETAAIRVGAILSNDLKSATDEMRVMVPNMSKSSPLLIDLLNYWASDAASSLRKKANLI